MIYKGVEKLDRAVTKARERCGDRIQKVRKIADKMAEEAKNIIRKIRKLAQKLKPENLADQSLLNEIHHVLQVNILVR